jgi:hypothetical protein
VAIAAVFSFAQTDWTKYYDNPVMIRDTTLSGTWEWAGIGQPFCLYESDTFKMWYAAAGVAYIGDTILRGRIMYAHSTDGIVWIKRNPLIPVLDVNTPGTWDSRWCDTPAMLKDSTGYKLYYYGDSLFVGCSALGVATSTDGLNFTRYADNPILEKGELLDWDGFWIESPAVLYDSASNTYQMWYTGVGWGPGYPNDNKIQIGYAFSYDGFNWTKDSLNNPVFQMNTPGNWDDGWVAVPAVRKTGDIYEMWYIGVSIADYAADSTLDTARVGYATSVDGINWVRYAGNPVLSNFDPPVDTGGPWAPDVVFGDSEYKMWYETFNGIYYASAPVNGIARHENRPVHVALNARPNPFSECIAIEYILPIRTSVHVPISSLAGQKTMDLIDSWQSAGAHRIVWNGKNSHGIKVSGGTYLIRLETNTGTCSSKCIIIK